MPVNLQKEKATVGEIKFNWKIREYEKVDRDQRWLIVMLVLAGLLVFFGLWSQNYLFVLLIVLFGIIMWLHTKQDPLEIDFSITQTGIMIGDKFYRFSEIKDFWLIYNPPEVKTLYLGFNRAFAHRLHIPLLDVDPQPIREYLNQFLEENMEEEEEPLSDKLARVFRLY
ncbi:MAG: hypothetical protein COU31_01660 [Candidatus Magasanikbacteria bacterium CG10_big_fil_rev_8_21_14_0_10_40_10]|uniref:DUF5673 domain-containing protein n=1 Tax=Candidatus Magasanikbacteria bacterium CG10_big_fil_rev_8_21_14_0_10_40_10 TaxID=1974648 RepID=A0A2M6W4D4_9BACT|nr:MAG: hypothetical protein COU31_01660 [Candidatus Magasanikbacteria bacterium CG10_big_fil_rev_8_21_14_0_10_40_10]